VVITLIDIVSFQSIESSAEFIKRFSYYLRSSIKLSDPQKGLHSFRHLVTDHLCPKVAKVEDAADPRRPKVEAVVSYREPLATKEMRYHRLSRLVGSSCPVVALRAKSEAESEAQRVKNMANFF
jgi:hypothetical protein